MRFLRWKRTPLERLNSAIRKLDDAIALADEILEDRKPSNSGIQVIWISGRN